MAPSQTAATPSVARNEGRTVVAISCDQSLNSDASPIPKVVRFSQDFDFMRKSTDYADCTDFQKIKTHSIV